MNQSGTCPACNHLITAHDSEYGCSVEGCKCDSSAIMEPVDATKIEPMILCEYCAFTKPSHIDGIYCSINRIQEFKPKEYSNYTPEVAAFAENTKSFVKGIKEGYRLAKSEQSASLPQNSEPVEAVSTTPSEVNCLEFGCTNYPTRGTHYCKKHLEVSTPLPQQRKDGHSALKPDGNGGFEKFDPHPALPQQEEPDLANILGVGKKFPAEQEKAIDLVTQMMKLGEHKGKEHAGIMYCLDVIVNLLRVPITPLLGQDEPKFSKPYDSKKRLAESVEKLVALLETKEAELTQSLTSLAAATEREKDLKSSFGITSERERTSLAEAITRISKAIAPRMWLVDGRGCYEWDDDTYRKEFGWAMNEVLDAINPLRKIAGDWTTCPMKAVELEAARMDWKQRAELAEASLAAMTEDRNLWQGEHNEDCPNLASLAEAQTRIGELEKELAR